MNDFCNLKIGDNVTFNLSINGEIIKGSGTITDVHKRALPLTLTTSSSTETLYYFVEVCEGTLKKMFIVYPQDIINVIKPTIKNKTPQQQIDELQQELDDLKKRVKILELMKNDTPTIPYIPTPPAQPIGPYWDPNYGKVWCETETHNYTSNIPLEDRHKYQETVSNSSDDYFDGYKHIYNYTCTDTNCKPKYYNEEKTIDFNFIKNNNKYPNKKK